MSKKAPAQQAPVPWSQALEDAWAEPDEVSQPAQQEPVAEVGRTSVFLLRSQPNGERWPEGTKLYTSQTAQRKPQFKEFIKWAGIQGYDCAQTFNSDTGEWICLNPMTADLWRAWQAAHNIKENT